MAITWKKDTRQFYSGDACYLGKWLVGSVNWVCGNKNDPEPKNYGAFCLLPGIKTELGKYTTAEEAKQKVEIAVTYWQSKVNES